MLILIEPFAPRGPASEDGMDEERRATRTTAIRQGGEGGPGRAARGVGRGP